MQSDSSIYLNDISADLHAHSTYSDGTLSPRALVQRAHAQGVEVFALTDHDEVGGLAEAAQAAAELQLKFIAGIELSVTWGATTLHIVGLGIDPANQALAAGIAGVRNGRLQRAREMADGLQAVGISGAYEGALKFAANVEMVSRTHFARHLVETGVCADVREVFERFLVEGRPGYVPHRWAKLSEAVGWIRAAGGVAVIAHPGRYRLNETAEWAMFEEFCEAGGQALEVSTANHSAYEIQRFAKLAKELKLEGSRGSDFHSPDESHVELNRVAPLPDSVVPVWRRFA